MISTCESTIIAPIPHEKPVTTACGTRVMWRPRRSTQKTIMMTAAAITLAAIGGTLALLPSLAPVLGVADGQGLTQSVVVMTLSFFFVAGLQSWIWPAFVFARRMGRCTFWSMVAVLAGQYTIGPALVYLTGYANPTWFSLGYLSYYVFSILPLWRELRREQPSFTWTAQEAVTP